MVAVQSVGTAAGNMIAIHNAVAASARVGPLGRDGASLRLTTDRRFLDARASGLIAMVAPHALGVTDPPFDRE